MIEITFKEVEHSLILEVKGHAGQSDAGHDIVCSAASILAYTFAQVARDMHENKMLRKKPTINIKKGDATVVIKPLVAHRPEAFNALYVVETGYSLLAHNYPEYVQITQYVGDKSLT